MQLLYINNGGRELWVFHLVLYVVLYSVMFLGYVRRKEETINYHTDRKKSCFVNETLDIISLPGEARPFADKLRPLV